MSNEEQTDSELKGNNPIAQVRNFLARDSIKARFEDIMGEKAAGFTTSMVNVMRGSRQLQACTPESIMTSGLVAASVDLPIEPALGMAAMVPYGNQAQFQIMWRGVVQLCLRTNQYADIQCTEIYRDELKSHNPITGKIEFHPPENYKLRYSDKKLLADVVGYYARFELVSGFIKTDYMSHAEVMAHAKKYSKAYQYDLAKNKQTSAWSTDPVPMGRKTVLLRILGRWGIKSIQLQKVLVGDKEDFATAQANATAMIAAETGSEPVDTKFEEEPGEEESRSEFLDDSEGEADAKAKADDEKKLAKAGKGKGKTAKWVCRQTKCKHKFDEPVACGKDDTPSCPRCLTSNIKEVA